MIDELTWRYHFADGRRFTSILRREFAEAQARAVEKVDGVAITLIEQRISGEWRALNVHSPKDDTQ